MTLAESPPATEDARILKEISMRPPFTLRLAFVLLIVLGWAGPAAARPGLWIAHSGNATIYLFGTVHLLPSDTAWSSPQLDEALQRSRSLTIELTDDDPATMQALVLKYGLDIAHPLSAKLDAQDRARLQQAAAAAKLSAASLNPMRPWLAALSLSIAPLMQAGLDPAEGVDKQLKARMQATGKPVLGLETAEQQIGFLAGMSEADQLAMLRESFEDIAEGPAKLRQLIAAWKAGDVAAIAKIEDEDLRQQSPALYRTLLVERNRRWAKLLAARLRQPGISFVAVGAGHLAGPDSLQQQLQKLGIAVQRQ